MVVNKIDRIKGLVAKGFSFAQAIHLDMIMEKGYFYGEALEILMEIERGVGIIITSRVNDVPERKW